MKKHKLSKHEEMEGGKHSKMEHKGKKAAPAMKKEMKKHSGRGK